MANPQRFDWETWPLVDADLLFCLFSVCVRVRVTDGRNGVVCLSVCVCVCLCACVRVYVCARVSVCLSASVGVCTCFFLILVGWLVETFLRLVGTSPNV